MRWLWRGCRKRRLAAALQKGSGFGGGGAQLSDSFVELARGVGNDTELTLDEHQLSAMVHFVFLGAEETFEAGLVGFSVGFGDVFCEEFRGESLKPGSKLFAFVAQEVDDFGFGAGLVFFGFELVDDAEEVEADQSGQALVFVDFFPDASGDGDVREHLTDRATIGCGDEVVFGFWNVFGDLNGVFAYRTKGSGQIFSTVRVHMDTSLG
jgi:hypothetical protein